MTSDDGGTGVGLWPLVEEKELGRYSLFTLVKSIRSSPGGRCHELLRLDAPDWVNVVALIASEEIVLVEQFRHGTGRPTLEIPGGVVEPGEDHRAAALRELEEETGYRPGRLHLLGTVEPNPAFLSNRCSTFLATECEPTGIKHPDPSEELVVRLVPLRRFTELIEGGVIRHALVVAAHDHLQRAIRRGEPWAPRP